MFGKKSEKTTGPNLMTQFSQGTLVTGDVSTEGDIRIDGKVNGNVTSKSKVVLGQSGCITGDVCCQNAYIDGRIDGNLEVAELLILSSNAVVAGDIRIKKLVVQEGAVFSGRCMMGMSVTHNQNTEKHVTAQQQTASA
ncbi:MAG: polymer-forming cytoskeletal protein [Chitinophagales bacterium]|nr:polymer-forming cytoskeletal protein [Chitinophagales bacterium]MDW8417839.1 polymer-forming cytoskeletal protein [Chitinophagales bacterium]